MPESGGFDSRLCHWNFLWHNPSGRTMALDLTQPLTEISTRNIFWGLKAAGAQGWQPYQHPVPLSWNMRNLAFWNPWNLGFADFKTIGTRKVVRLSALRTGRLYPSGNTPVTHFCQSLSQSQGHSAAGRIISMKNSNDTIGNRTRDLPACSVVPKPTAPPCAPDRYKARYYLELHTTPLLYLNLQFIAQ